ncbi:MAG: hypothetical protein ACI9EF_001114 [Pseudohongiellaceae bacterium]
MSTEQQEMLDHMSIVQLDDGAGNLVNKTLRISGINVQIVNGLGATNGNTRNPFTINLPNTTVNGLGNLIVGYKELGNTMGYDRTGSHNVVLGQSNSYKSFGGQVGGRGNTITGLFAALTGGEKNHAKGFFGSISGGKSNTVKGKVSSISGGWFNTAAADTASVSGGQGNKASGNLAWVGGGKKNTASGLFASVTGGTQNWASGSYASVSAGVFNSASGEESWVGGGFTQSGQRCVLFGERW